MTSSTCFSVSDRLRPGRRRPNRPAARLQRLALPDTDEALNPPSPRLQSQQAEGELTSSRPVRSDPLLPVIINNNLEYYAG